MTPVFKLALLGDSGVGKTTFLSRFHKALVRSDEVAKATVYSLSFLTNVGEVIFECYNIEGKKSYSDLSFEFFNGCVCAIIMFDLTDMRTYEHVACWHDRLLGHGFDVATPIVLLGNKADDVTRPRVVTATTIKFHRGSGHMKYFDFSAVANYNILQPFEFLLKTLTSDDNICLVEAPMLAAPEVALAMLGS